jgi:hypothetical protein
MKYTLEQYRNLCFEDNHKIIKEYGEYYWYAKKDTKYTKHCIKSFSDHKKVLSHIRYWIPKYKKLAINPKDCIDTMLKQLLMEDEIEVISKNKDINLTKKIGKILKINPDIKPKELVALLDVTKMTISRQLKLFKAI